MDACVGLPRHSANTADGWMTAGTEASVRARLGWWMGSSFFLEPFAAEVLGDLRRECYEAANPDLGFRDLEHARWHLAQTGFYEGRLFDKERIRTLDPGWYRRRYPELELVDDADAQRHYAYRGYYEKRLPNESTEWLANATLHIYQLGRVGSHSIASAVAEYWTGGMLQAHWPADFRLAFPQCGLTYSELVRYPKSGPIHFVSGVRELVGRHVSGTLQYLHTHGQQVLATMSAADICEYLRAALFTDCETTAAWFEHQFYFDYDVYAHEFDTQRGHGVWETEGARGLIYRFESIADLGSGLGEFLKIPRVVLERRNTSSSLQQKELVKRAQSDFVLSSTELDRIYDCDYMRHFYTADERQAFRHYWCKPRA